MAGDIATEEGRAAALKACPAPDILVNNAGGPPPGDFRQWDREDVDQGARREHARADPADPRGGRRHDRAALRPHREHHLRRGEAPDSGAGAVERRAHRPYRLRRRSRARHRQAQRDDQQPPAGAVRHRPAAVELRIQRQAAWERARRSSRARAWRRIRPGASARPRNSAMPAPTCAVRKPASSPDKTCSSTAALTRARSRIDPSSTGGADEDLCSAGSVDRRVQRIRAGLSEPPGQSRGPLAAGTGDRHRGARRRREAAAEPRPAFRHRQPRRRRRLDRLGRRGEERARRLHPACGVERADLDHAEPAEDALRTAEGLRADQPHLRGAVCARCSSVVPGGERAGVRRAGEGKPRQVHLRLLRAPGRRRTSSPSCSTPWRGFRRGTSRTRAARRR